MARSWTVLLGVILFLTISVPIFAGTYSGGSGTAEDPFRIFSVADWQKLIAASADYDKHFILLNDIDFGGINLTPIAPDTSSTGGFQFQGIQFTGIFDGNNHVLSNASIHLPDTDFVGLFGYLGVGGQIRNLGMVNIPVFGGQSVGGMCGLNAGFINNCFSTGSVTGTQQASSLGGLCGGNTGTISHCYATGTVNGGSFLGGLCGSSSGFIVDCYATGSVTGPYRSIGGLCGSTSGKIDSSFATGDVISGDNALQVGGLCGENTNMITTLEITIRACYATGSVTVRNNSQRIGGLCGVNFRVISSCYARGNVTAGENSRAVGGLNGEGNKLCGDCFWDIQTSGMANSAGGRGLTTAQMKTCSIFQNAGWGNQGWVMQDTADYPRLAWENTGASPIPTFGDIPLTGNGTLADPYQIHTTEEFASVSGYRVVFNRSFQLMADLDLEGVDLFPIGDSVAPFTGAFDGASHVIRNGRIVNNGIDNIGLFGYTSSTGQIHNLGMDNVFVSGGSCCGGLCGWNEGTILATDISGIARGTDCASLGGLCGYNTGTINRCFAKMDVDGGDHSWYLGGLCGINKGAIGDCCAIGSVRAQNESNYLGGLCGTNNSGIITDCFSMSSVSGINHIGGFVGRNYRGKIFRCYSNGKPTGTTSVGGFCGSKDTGSGYEASGNVWDTQTSQTTISSMGAGMTTTQMMSRSIYIDRSWDFVGELGNGTADTWRMCTDGIDYPRLSWEFAQGGDVDCPNGVGSDDLQYLSARWLTATPETIGASDANSDGKADLADFAILAAHWLKEL